MHTIHAEDSRTCLCTDNAQIKYKLMGEHIHNPIICRRLCTQAVTCPNSSSKLQTPTHSFPGSSLGCYEHWSSTHLFKRLLASTYDSECHIGLSSYVFVIWCMGHLLQYPKTEGRPKSSTLAPRWLTIAGADPACSPPKLCARLAAKIKLCGLQCSVFFLPGLPELVLS